MFKRNLYATDRQTDGTNCVPSLRGGSHFGQVDVHDGAEEKNILVFSRILQLQITGSCQH